MLAVTWATKNFRCYIYVKKFVVHTGQAALRYLYKFADNNSRLLRWSLRLSEFDFEFEHRPATQIRHVDALCPHVQVGTTDHTLSKEVV
jgi:hypothetical protein